MTEDSSRSEREHRARHQRDEGNTYLGYGLGVGAIGVVSGVIGAAVCPVCVVATPALLGAGIYKHLQARRSRAAQNRSPED